MAMITQNFRDLISNAIDKVFSRIYEKWPQQWKELYDSQDCPRGELTLSSITGFNVPSIKAEGEAMGSDEKYQGYDVTGYSYVRAMYTEITMEMIRRDQKQKMKEIPGDLAEAFGDGKNYEMAKPFNYGFVTTYFSCGDALSLFNASHLRADGGGTYSNTSSALQFSATGLATARLQMRQQVNDRGLKINIMPKRLIVPTDLEETAEIILKTDKKIDSMNNDINFLKGKFAIKVWDYLSSATAWFLAPESPKKTGLVYLDEWGQEAVKDTDFSTQNILYGRHEAYGCMVRDPRPLWGTAGA